MRRSTPVPREQVLNRLESGSRLVALVRKGMSHDSHTFKGWFKKLETLYNIRSNVGIDGRNYSMYGTQFNIQIIVIDKNGPTTAPVLKSQVTDLEKLHTLLGGIRNDRSRIKLENDISTRPQESQEGESASGLVRTLPGDSVQLGTSNIDRLEESDGRKSDTNRRDPRDDSSTESVGSHNDGDIRTGTSGKSKGDK